MGTNLSTIQQYYRIQRVVSILLFLIVSVSLFLPYSKVDISSLYLPAVFSNYTTYGYELDFSIAAVILSLICTIFLTVTKNRITAILAAGIAILIVVALFILPEEIRFNRIFIKPSGADYNYGLGFYLVMIGGIGIILIAFVNMLLVVQNPQKQSAVNSDLIDDL